MSAITWTRNEYTPIADATEREAWYADAGLGDWFDITMGTGGNNADVFTIQPYTDGAKLVLNFMYMNKRGSTGGSTERLNTTQFYSAGASSTTTISAPTIAAGEDYGKLSFDFSTAGSVELLRICTADNIWSDAKEMIFARDTTVTADGDTAHLIVMSCPMSNNSRPLYGTYIFMSDTTQATQYEQNSNANVQFVTRSIGYSDKFILQPIQTLGIISHIYAIDGSPNYAPMGDTEFTLGSHTYYSLGHGMCVKVK